MIPKTIHYMWFSGEEKTPLAKRCIESWRKFCPGWEIVEWDLAKCAAEGRRRLPHRRRAQEHRHDHELVALDRPLPGNGRGKTGLHDRDD
jgi:mannosyltransferase OCH1-like enzyme